MTQIDTNLIATNLIEDAIKGAWGKVKGFFVDVHKKDCVDCGDAFENYLLKTKERNTKIKTLIYRREPVDLYSFYECVGVLHKEKIIDTSKIENILNIGSKVIFTGTGGIGKSILLKHFFVNTIIETNYIPVLLELRTLNALASKSEFTIERAIYNNLINNGFNLEYKYFEYSLQNGAYIFLFDGYDELNKENSHKIGQAIREMSNKYEKNKYFLTSRPADEFIGWSDFIEMSACNLSKEQALSLIKKIKFDEALKEKFYKALDSELFEKHKSFASNPLLLNIMLLTFEKYAVVPDNLIDFYENAFSALFNEHDATKDCYQRDIKSGLNCEKFKNVLAHICLKSYMKNEFEFNGTKLNKYIKDALVKTNCSENLLEEFKQDLLSSVCLIIKDGITYKFAHRSFQEYFAAWYMCKITDDHQVILFNEHLNESHRSLNDMFLPILFNFQQDKFNKLYLCPYIEKIRELYDKLGFNLRLINEIFDGFSVRTVKEKNNKKGLSLAYILKSKNKYAEIFFLTCRLNGVDSKNYIADEKKFAEKLMESSKNSFCTIKVEELSSLFEEKEILTYMQFIEKRLVFMFSILEKYEKTSNIKKAKDILDII